MKRLDSVVKRFFNLLEMEEDKKKGHDYKGYMRASVGEFIKENNNDNAYSVYSTFLDSYRFKLQGDKNFIDLLDILKAYEENAATLIKKQRDHYIHSINVFILGIEVYINNDNFRRIINEYFDKKEHSLGFENNVEEFFFQWGIASLFHDIGYPVEITYNQIKEFIDFVAGNKEKDKVKPYIGYNNFDSLVKIPSTELKQFPFITDDGVKINTTNILELLGFSIHQAFEVDINLITENLNDFIDTMKKTGFVDHGFYSAIIVMGWYGSLLGDKTISDNIYYNSILNASSAILLHNYYKNVLQRSPFNLPRLDPTLHPLAYLLILCDELQEWNRKAYGILDKQRVLAADSDISVDDRELRVHFITYEGTLSEDFASNKEKEFLRLLDIEKIFKDSIHITTTTKTEQYVGKIIKDESMILPRPFLENIEQMAKEIHHNYNLNQLKKNPDKELEYPSWDSLSDDLKYSNVRQARGYFDKLKLLGMIATDNYEKEKEIIELSSDQVEFLSRQEHDSWYQERKANGWIYGESKDVEKKTSPYMLPYDELSEEIKDLDRDAVHNIIPLIHGIGLKIYKI